MKIDRILCLCAVIAFPQFALAEPQSNNQSTEIVHAIIDFCAQSDPVNAAKYQELARHMFREASTHDMYKVEDHESDKAGDSGKFVSVYEQTRAALGEIPKHDAVADCRGMLE